MTAANRSPAELRSMFGDNLRVLARGYPSISALTRRLGINRTQFNRYLAGESFPRPDVLDRICRFFEVDARILLQPVAELGRSCPALDGPVLGAFLGEVLNEVTEEEFPGGFYRVVRRSFADETRFTVRVVFVFRDKGLTCLRGYRHRDGKRRSGPGTTPAEREFRGLVTRQADGLGLIAARRGGTDRVFGHLSRARGFAGKLWAGYMARPSPGSPAGILATRVVCEHLGHGPARALPAARTAGTCGEDALAPRHRRLLGPGQAIC